MVYILYNFSAEVGCGISDLKQFILIAFSTFLNGCIDGSSVVAMLRLMVLSTGRMFEYHTLIYIK